MNGIFIEDNAYYAEYSNDTVLFIRTFYEYAYSVCEKLLNDEITFMNGKGR